MKRNTKILAAIVILALVTYALVCYFCPNKYCCCFKEPTVPPPCDSVKHISATALAYQLDVNGQIVLNNDNKPELKPIEIRKPYRCNEIILDASRPDAAGLRDFLQDLGFVQVNDCHCTSLGPELWRYAGSGTVDLIGVVKDPPPTGGGVGGMLLNYIVEDFGALDSIRFVDSTTIDTISIENPVNICTKQSVKIAIVDSGADIDVNNPLKVKAGAAWKMAPLTSTCTPPVTTVMGLDMDPLRGPEPIDENGHGTHINGIAVGLSSPSGGTSEGVELKFINARFTEGTKKEGSLFQALCGIYYAMEQGAEVINISWGFYDEDEPVMLGKIMDEADKNNVMIVAGMGNRGIYIGTSGERFWPACYANKPNVISVGAVVDQTSHRLADFSNWSLDANVMTVSAVGQDVISTYPMHLTPSTTTIGGKKIVSGWVKQSGTSMATPYASRTVAVMKGIGKKDPALTVSDIKLFIQINASTQPNRQYDHMQLCTQMCNTSIPIH